MLESGLELQIWSLAAHMYRPELEPMVASPLMQYRRRPSLNDPTRVYQSSMEPSAFQVLARALVANDHPGACLERGYIEIRSGLRWRLKRQLLQTLTQDQHATDAMRDTYFAGDLGL